MIPTVFKDGKLWPFDMSWVPIIIFTLFETMSETTWWNLDELLMISLDKIHFFATGNLFDITSAIFSIPKPGKIKVFFCSKECHKLLNTSLWLQ